MNKWIRKKLNIILIVFLLLHPFFDLLTGLSLNILTTSITAGMIFRMLFLLFILYTTIVVYQKKRVLLYLGVLFIYTVLFLFTNGQNLFVESAGLFRVFYFPLVLLSLFELKDKIKISKMTLVIVFFMYLLLLFVPKLIEVGFASYEITKVGTIGFFYSANEIGAILSILLPLVFIGIYKRKFIPFYLLLLILFLVTVTYIGTKTPLLAFVIILFMICLWCFINWIKTKQYTKIIVVLVGIVSLGVISLQVVPNTNFYKNIRTHLDFLEVDNISEITRDRELIDHFIFSQRLTFLEDRHEQYVNSSISEQLIGLGYQYDGENVKMIEMDYFDVFYSHGIIGFILFFSVYGYVLVKVLKEKHTLTFERLMLYASLGLILGLSLFTGHIIVAPSVSFIVVLMILQLSKEKKRLLFTAYDLRIGGIETSLVELLNHIDYEKYEVTLILEKKEGVLLKDINKNVLIKEHRVSNHSNKIIRKAINFLRYKKQLIFNNYEYDFSCTYATYSKSGVKLALMASRNNCLYVHSDYSNLYKEKEYREFFDTRSIDKFHSIVFVSNESRKYFISIYPKLENKTVVINNFIDHEKVLKLSKEKINEEKKDTTFVFVGRLDDSSKKLKRAFDLIKSIPKTTLWVIGDGDDRKLYEDIVKKEKLEKRILFFGFKTNPYPYIQKADYVLLTSDYEGFPVIYLEAIALNTPIITTIEVSDDAVSIPNRFGYIISKDEKNIKDVKQILKKKFISEELDFNQVNRDKVKELEKLFDEVVS